jgi:hypothetical protein
MENNVGAISLSKLLKTDREISQQESMHTEPILILETLKRENQHLHGYLLTLAISAKLCQHQPLEASRGFLHWSISSH